MKTIFSHFGSLAVLIIAIVLVNLFYQVDSVIFAMNIFLGAGFIWPKFTFSFLIMKGNAQNVALKLRKRNLDFYCIRFLKMSAVHAFIAFLPLLPICAILIIAFSDSAATLGIETLRNVRSLSISMFLSVLSCFAHWFFHWQDYFFGDEYKVRVELKNAGCEDSCIEGQPRIE